MGFWDIMEVGNDNGVIKKFEKPAGNLIVRIYEDRITIKKDLFCQPSTIFIKDITGYSTTDAGWGKAYINIYGHGTTLYSETYPVNWSEDLISFLQENINISHNNSPTQTAPLTLDDLAKLKQLLDAGIITQEDFDAAKRKLLY